MKPGPKTTNHNFQGRGVTRVEWEMVCEFVHKTRGTNCANCGQPTKCVRHKTHQRLQNDWHIDTLVPRCAAQGCSPFKPPWELKQYVYSTFIRSPTAKLDEFKTETEHPWRYSNQIRKQHEKDPT